MFEKIFAEIKQKPENHIVLIFTVLTAFIGLCSWQYCKGYYQIIGIPISYSQIDNLVFLFDQLSEISFRDQDRAAIPWYYYLIFVLSLFAIEALRFGYDFFVEKKLSKNGTATLDENIGSYLFPLSLLTISLALGVFYTAKAGTALSKVTVMFFFTWALFRCVKQTWMKDIVSLKILMPIYIFSMLYLVVGMFRLIGEIDGKIVILSEYSNLNSVCLSDVVSNAESNPNGFRYCGKLVHIDSNRICLKEEGAYPTCRQRGLYEITVIPN